MRVVYLIVIMLAGSIVLSAVNESFLIAGANSNASGLYRWLPTAFSKYIYHLTDRDSINCIDVFIERILFT